MLILQAFLAQLSTRVLLVKACRYSYYRWYIAAILYPMDDITDFLYLIGSVFAPMIAILLADYFYQSPTSTNDLSLSRARFNLGGFRWTLSLYVT